MYDHGEAFGRTIKAVRWYRKAADQGIASAQFNLGWDYDFGEGFRRMRSKRSVGIESRRTGPSSAQVNLGWAYAHGNGVPKNAIEAVHWYRKAAEQGDADAQINLGVAYVHGEGVFHRTTRKHTSGCASLHRGSWIAP